jgi:CheY-like chemotaxis protein
VSEFSTILLLENDENDVFFFKRALSSLHFDGQLRVVENVAQARHYIQGLGQFRDRQYYPLPDLVVSDMKMVGHIGLDFLQWLLRHSAHPRFPSSCCQAPQPRANIKPSSRSERRHFFGKPGTLWN